MRPRDAATLIIIRDRREVLLGMRNARHVFMPHRYVFPGGGVDSGDARVACPIALPELAEQRLMQSTSKARARALAMAAVRETYEETGLILGARCQVPLRTRSPHWRAFYGAGFVPALDKLDYFARAITPPGMVRRFDARFFTVDANHVCGELDGNGELGDLHWVNLADIHTLQLAPITELVLHLLGQFLPPKDKAKGLADTARYRELIGRELVELHEPAL
jgi:8-oxo-dGTP pyrophosphatase MutT (NUDIX family)